MPHILHHIRLPWFGFALCLLLLCSCREKSIGDLEFPYAKKKYFAEMFLPDTSLEARGTAWRHPGPANPYISYSILAHALDSHFQVKPEWKFCEPFLWLQSDSLEEDKTYWIRKQEETTQAYLKGVQAVLEKDRKENEDRKKPMDWEYLPQFGIALPEGLYRDSLSANGLPLHLFYQGILWEDGGNPVVLMPCPRTGHETVRIPKSFFDKGGCLAVAGGYQHVIVQDSSLFFAKADSLRRRIYRDTVKAHIDERRWIYQRFLSNHAELQRYVKQYTIEKPIKLNTGDLLFSANYLIANSITTPSRLALLALGQEQPLAEESVCWRGDLFQAAVIEPAPDSCRTEFWKKLRNHPDTSIPEMSMPDKQKAEGVPARPMSFLELTSEAIEPYTANNALPKERASFRSGHCHSTPSLLKGKIPAILTEADPGYYALSAYVQEQSGRRCGQKPFLLVSELATSDTWAFILYQICLQ